VAIILYGTQYRENDELWQYSGIGKVLKKIEIDMMSRNLITIEI